MAAANEKNFKTDGMSIAPGVVETIVAMAAAEVEGVAGVGAAGPLAQIMATFNAGKPVPTQGVDVSVDDDQKLSIAITVQVFYGRRLVDVAAAVRRAVADALAAQIGVETAAVDVHIDSLLFSEDA